MVHMHGRPAEQADYVCICPNIDVFSTSSNLCYDSHISTIFFFSTVSTKQFCSFLVVDHAVSNMKLTDRAFTLLYIISITFGTQDLPCL
jgi:hypothetical protein